MAQWGRNDQAVTANSTTTKETSTGAPIGTYALVKGSGNGTTPISMSTNAHFGNTSPGSRASVDVNMFDNTTPGAFISGQAVGVFGVSAAEIANNRVNSSKEKPAHAGWTLRKAGSGGIVSVSYTGTATGYSNSDTLTIASPVAGGNATVTISTNSTGGALVLTITDPGYGFTAVNATANIDVTSTSNTSATFSAVAGGRAGRVHSETLIAMHSLGVNSTSSTGVTGPSSTVKDATSDNTLYPGT